MAAVANMNWSEARMLKKMGRLSLLMIFSNLDAKLCFCTACTLGFFSFFPLSVKAGAIAPTAWVRSGISRYRERRKSVSVLLFATWYIRRNEKKWGARQASKLSQTTLFDELRGQAGGSRVGKGVDCSTILGSHVRFCSFSNLRSVRTLGIWNMANWRWCQHVTEVWYNPRL